MVCLPAQPDGGEGAEEDAREDDGEEDYIDSEDELEVKNAPHENAFVYIDESGKLVYVEPDEPQEAEEAAGEEKEKEEEKQEAEEEDKEEDTEEEKQVARGEKADGLEGNDAEEEKSLSSGSAAVKGFPDALGEETTGRDANSESKDSGEEAPPCPLPRINPCLTVRGNTLYVYGGLLEVGACILTHG